jgi:hypothetical protein
MSTIVTTLRPLRVPSTSRMTSAQPALRMFSPGVIKPDHQELSTTDWQMFDKPETLEDIRFTFSIWHQPIKTESRSTRTDDGFRARTPSRSIRQAVPFAWLPLLPIEEAPVEVVDKRESGVVSTGYPLVLPTVDEEAALPPNLVRRASVAVIDSEQETSIPRKKQRLDADNQDLEAVEATIDHSQIASPVEIRRKEVLDIKIQKVRMRDVDVVEDFLVSSTVQSCTRATLIHCALTGSILARVWNGRTVTCPPRYSWGLGIGCASDISPSGRTRRPRRRPRSLYSHIGTHRIPQDAIRQRVGNNAHASHRCPTVLSTPRSRPTARSRSLEGQSTKCGERCGTEDPVEG